MNGRDIFLGLKYIGDDLIEKAEYGRFPQCGEKVEKKRSAHNVRRRPFLIAAIIALMLFMMGCAWLVMRMQDLQIGEHTITQAQSENEEKQEMSLDVLSLQGMKDTPQYLANQEWLQFTQSYVPELAEFWESDPAYWAYNVQNQVMVDKLNEICEKYGLEVIGKPWHEHVDCGQFLLLTGVESLLKADSSAAIHMPGGRFFPGGSFTIYGTLTPSAAEKSVAFTYHYVRKDVFYDVFAYVDSGSVTENHYTTEDGLSLLLLESESSGMIMADREDCFITVSIEMNEAVSLKKIADQFDFTIHTIPIDAAAADAREQASIDEAYSDDPYKDRFVRDTYGEYVADLLWSDSYMLMNGFTADEIPEREYAFYDLDGNGEEELLILYDGFIGSVIGWKDGKTDEGKTYHMTLCENNVLIEQSEFGSGEVWYHIFYFANNGETVFSNPKEQSIVRLKNDNGTWWRTSSTDHYADFDTQITEEEAMEILNSYTPVDLESRPLAQFQEPDNG